MTNYNAIGEIQVAPTEKRATGWVDALAGYHPAVGRTDRGWSEIVITYPAADLGQAIATGRAVLFGALGQLDRFEVLTTDEYDQRSADIGLPDMVTTVEAADIIGITRQRVLQMVESGAIPSKRVGDRTLVLPRLTVEAIAAARAAGKTIDG